jgi:hypothetical protein
MEIEQPSQSEKNVSALDPMKHSKLELFLDVKVLEMAKYIVNIPYRTISWVGKVATDIIR